jgi:hypothetical protein
MPGKLLAAIARDLTLDDVDAMAAQIGIDRASARKAAELAVPALVSGLSELPFRANGIARLTSALAHPSANPGEDRKIPQPPGEASLITFLLGSGSAEVLASAIGRFVGACPRSMHAFLDGLAATVLGAIAEECRLANDNGKGLATLLRTERELATAAMPAGLSDLLRGNGFYARLGRPELAALPRAVGAPTDAEQAVSPRRARNAYARCAYWALPFSALIAGVCYFHAAAINEWVALGGTEAVTSLPERIGRSAGTVSQGGLADSSYQGRDVYDRAGQKIGTVSELLVGAEGQLAAALVSLSRFLGFGEDRIALPVADLLTRQDHDGVERLVVDLAKDELKVAPLPPASRQELRFSSPQFKNAIAITLPAGNDRPGGPR